MSLGIGVLYQVAPGRLLGEAQEMARQLGKRRHLPPKGSLGEPRFDGGDTQEKGAR